MDSASTAIAILILGSVATFLVVQGAAAAMPLLRRSAVREMLSDRGLREASLRRLRTSRSAYEETIHLLSLASSAGVPALMAVLLLRETGLALLAIGLAAASWIALVLMGSLSAYVVRKLRADRLIVCATGFPADPMAVDAPSCADGMAEAGACSGGYEWLRQWDGR